MFRKKCLICGSTELIKIVDLGIQPFADTFVKEEDLARSELTYPLGADLCDHCGQVQSSCETNPDDRYNLTDYSYTSSNSDFSRNHWKQYCKDMLQNRDILSSGEDFIIEIGSNDGFLLRQFALKGFSNILGIDPSKKMQEIAKKENCVNTMCDLFPVDDEVEEHIFATHGTPKLIIANNVFNHSDEPVLFMKQVSEMLSDDGCFVFELPYWKATIESGKIDQVYHEHVSYFTVKSSQSLADAAGLKIVKLQKIDYHGGSIRVHCKKQRPGLIEAPEVEKYIAEEKSMGLFEKKTYDELMQELLSRRNRFMKTIYSLKLLDKPIIAVGAAAKGNTFLNFYNLDNSLVDYVTDTSKHKQGKYTPLTRIPITSDEIFEKYDEVYALILSWNISTKIKEILKEINPNIVFISPEGEGE